jgi:hypothetical protein
VIAEALNSLGLYLGLGQDRQKQGGKNGNDGDNYEQFNQSKAINCQHRAAA